MKLFLILSSFLGVLFFYSKEVRATYTKSQDPVKVWLNSLTGMHQEIPPSKVKELIERGGNPRSVDGEGNTLLHLAAFNGNKPLADLLTEIGVDINAQTDYGNTPFMFAVRFGQFHRTNLTKSPTMAQDFLTKGADPRLTDHAGNNAFHYIAMFGDASLAALALHNVDFSAKSLFINKKNGVGEAPLHKAIDNLEVMRWLLENGAEVNIINDRNETPLFLAVEEDDGDNDWEIIEGVTILLAHGANPELENYRQETPLEIAEENDSTEIASLLKQAVKEKEIASLLKQTAKEKETASLLEEGKPASPAGEADCGSMDLEEDSDLCQFLLASQEAESLFPGTGPKVDRLRYTHIVCALEEKKGWLEKAVFEIKSVSVFPSYRGSCEDRNKVDAIIASDESWKERAGGILNDYDPETGKGVLYLSHNSSQAQMGMGTQWMDCFLFPCWKNNAHIEIAGRTLKYNRCSGDEPGSGCDQKITEWREKLESGYRLKVFFQRSIRDPFMLSAGWFPFAGYYIKDMKWEDAG